MYVVVLHRITDPDRFWDAVERSAGARPVELCLRQALFSPRGRRCVALWETPSLRALRAFSDAALGSVSRNHYFVVDELGSIGVPAHHSVHTRFREPRARGEAS